VTPLPDGTYPLIRLDWMDLEGLAGCQLLFSGMPIDTGMGFTSTSLGGHGGILTYDSNGATKYHEYGRYPTSQAVGSGLPSDEDNVRRLSVPNLHLDKYGQPTPESMEALKKFLEQKAGKGTDSELTCDASADEKKILEYINQVAKNPKRPKYRWKPWERPPVIKSCFRRRPKRLGEHFTIRLSCQ
jgi:hypothetical protein